MAAEAKAATVIGKGTYGRVVADGKHAVKSFQEMEMLVAEVFVTRYVSSKCGQNVIKLKRRNLAELSMSTERWHCSLQDLIWKSEHLSSQQSRAIFRSLLRAMADLEALRIVHADIKPGNIFLSEDYMTAVLGDFGVSSISGSAHIGCTTKEYSSSQYANYRSHDSYGVAIVGLQLLYGYRLMIFGAEYRDKSALRADIMNLVPAASADREGLLGLVHDDPKKCWTATKVLQKMYNDKYQPSRPPRPLIYDKDTDVVLDLQISYHLGKLCDLYKVKRKNRCFACCRSMLSRMKSDISPLVLVTVMVYIFRCVFGFTEKVERESRMSLEDGLLYSNTSLAEFIKLIDTVLGQKDVIDLMFYF